MENITKFIVQTERQLVPPQEVASRYAVASIVAAVSDTGHTPPPVAISFAIDRSGSMRGRRLEMARDAVTLALHRLRPIDSFAIVFFDGHVDVGTPLQFATPAAVSEAIRRMDDFPSAGSTNLFGGWEIAASELRHADADVKRVIVLTDGQANSGDTNHRAIERKAQDLHEHGVVTTTLGLGIQFNEQLLALMARAGRGQFYFAKTAEALPAIIEREVVDARDVVARNVSITCVPGPDVTVTCLADFATSWDGNRLRVDFGDLLSGQKLDVAFEVEVRVAGPRSRVEWTLSDSEGPLPFPVQACEWLPGSFAESDNQPLNAAVARVVAQQLVARAVVAMTEANQRRRYLEVEKIATVAVAELNAMGRQDPGVRGVINDFLRQAEELAREVGEMRRKDIHMYSSSRSKSRHDDGSSIR